MPTTLARSILVAAAMAGSACSGDESFRLFPVDPGSLDTRFLETCRYWSEAATAYEERCGRGRQTALRIERATMDCQIMLADPNVGAVESDLRDCASSLPKTACTSQGPGLLSTTPALAACNLPAGKSAVGAVCMLSHECATGRCAADSSSSDAPMFCGRCAKAAVKSEPCGEACPEGTVCSTRDLACHRPEPDGAMCSDAGDCESLFCSQGVCNPRAGLGEPCGLLLYDDKPLCADNLFCGSNWACGRYIPVADGERCGRHGDDLWTCPSGSTCAYWIDEPVCIPPVPDGSPCSSDQGLNCRKPALCLGGVCHFPDLLDCVQAAR